MSDVGLNFSGLEIFAIGTIIALPLTTILLVILVWRRIAGRSPRRALNAGIFVLGLLWVFPVGPFGGDGGRRTDRGDARGSTPFHIDCRAPDRRDPAAGRIGGDARRL
jgi:hypothetical protein